VEAWRRVSNRNRRADHVWVLHRPTDTASRSSRHGRTAGTGVDAEGNFNQPGAAGSGTNGRKGARIHIDYKGFVWIGGKNNCRESPARLKPAGDDQLLKFTQAGQVLMQIGHSRQESTGNATRRICTSRDAFVYRKTNEVFVADGYAIIAWPCLMRIRARLAHVGAFGNKPVDLDQVRRQASRCPRWAVLNNLASCTPFRVSDDG